MTLTTAGDTPLLVNVILPVYAPGAMLSARQSTRFTRTEAGVVPESELSEIQGASALAAVHCICAEPLAERVKVCDAASGPPAAIRTTSVAGVAVSVCPWRRGVLRDVRSAGEKIRIPHRRRSTLTTSMDMISNHSLVV